MSIRIRAVLYHEDAVASFHFFELPGLCEKLCYRHTTSLDAFRRANVALLNKAMLKNKLPVRRVHVGHAAEAIIDVEASGWQGAPVYTHADIYAFYKAIGWCYTRKKYWKGISK